MTPRTFCLAACLALLPLGAHAQDCARTVYDGVPEGTVPVLTPERLVEPPLYGGEVFCRVQDNVNGPRLFLGESQPVGDQVALEARYYQQSSLLFLHFEDEDRYFRLGSCWPDARGLVCDSELRDPGGLRMERAFDLGSGDLTELAFRLDTRDFDLPAEWSAPLPEGRTREIIVTVRVGVDGQPFTFRQVFDTRYEFIGQPAVPLMNAVLDGQSDLTIEIAQAVSFVTEVDGLNSKRTETQTRFFIVGANNIGFIVDAFQRLAGATHDAIRSGG